MDKELLEIKKIVTEASEEVAKKAVAQMREFHLDDLKVLKERMDIGFESVDRRFNQMEERLDTRIDRVEDKLEVIDQRLEVIDQRLEVIDQRLDQTENALQVLLNEFKKHRDEVDELKRKNLELTQRVQVLERELASMK